MRKVEHTVSDRDNFCALSNASATSVDACSVQQKRFQSTGRCFQNLERSGRCNCRYRCRTPFPCYWMLERLMRVRRDRQTAPPEAPRSFDGLAATKSTISRRVLITDWTSPPYAAHRQPHNFPIPRSSCTSARNEWLAVISRHVFIVMVAS